MSQAYFRSVDDESARLEMESPDGKLTLVINPFGPKLWVPSEDVDDEAISADYAADILNTAAGHVDPDSLETAFELLDEHGG